MDIEWLIMDDGSTDNTKELIKNYIKKGYKKILIDMSKSFTKTKKNGKDSICEIILFL